MTHDCVVSLFIWTKRFELVCGVQPHEQPLLELLECPEEALEAVRFAAATGALTTQRGGAIAAQPSLVEIEQLVAEARAAGAA